MCRERLLTGNKMPYNMINMAEDEALSTDRQDSEKPLCVSFREVLYPGGSQTVDTEKKASCSVSNIILRLMRF